MMDVRSKKGFGFIESIFGSVAPLAPEASVASRLEASRRVISPI